MKTVVVGTSPGWVQGPSLKETLDLPLSVFKEKNEAARLKWKLSDLSLKGCGINQRPGIGTWYSKLKIDPCHRTGRRVPVVVAHGAVDRRGGICLPVSPCRQRSSAACSRVAFSGKGQLFCWPNRLGQGVLRFEGHQRLP